MLLSSLLTCSVLLGCAFATLSNKVPDSFDGQPWPVAPRFNYSLDDTSAGVEETSLRKRGLSGKVNMAYFPNWGDFRVTSIPASRLSHVLYAFADCDPSTGALFLTNNYADTQMLYDGDNGDDGNLFGNLKQLYLLKQKNRGLKTLLSVGGWTYGQDGHFDMITDSSWRSTFISTAISALEDYGFDGIDIDYEYPGNSAQGQGLADLLTGLRTALTKHAKAKGDSTPYLVTAAVGADVSAYQYFPFSQMNKALDIWSLMSYDYSGSWSSVADYQANLKGDTPAGINTVESIEGYTSRGASISKIAMGIPLYARTFKDTAGMFKTFVGVGNDDGITNYNEIPSGEVTEDTKEYVGAFTISGGTLYSYDTPTTANVKAKYINSHGLAGAMYWDVTGDRTGHKSIITKVKDTLGQLDDTPNHLSYPGSQFANVRDEMGQGSGSTGSSTTQVSSTTTSSTKTSSTKTSSKTLSFTTSIRTSSRATTTTSLSITKATSTSTTSTPTSTPGSGSCAAVAAWNKNIIYVWKDAVTFEGWLWMAQWWTIGETPYEDWGKPWKKVKQC